MLEEKGGLHEQNIKDDTQGRQWGTGMRVRRWILLGLWILSLITISFYGGAVSYGFFFGVTLVPVISLIYLLCVYFRFKIYQETESRNMVCDQPMSYYFVLENEDYFAYTGISVRMYSSFSHVEEFPDNVEYELLPGDKSTYETKIVCKYRGEYGIGVKEVILTDFFRLFRLRHVVSGQIKAMVSPKIVQLSELSSIVDMPILSRQDAFGNTEPDILVRDYVQGDSLKQVHWKATAREGKLKIRTMTGRENQGISIFCDTKRHSEEMRDYLPLENKILEAFLAVGFFFAGKEMEFFFCYGQGEVIRGRVDGIKEFEGFYHRVSEIAFDEGCEPQEALEHAMEWGDVWNSRIVFCILHELTPAMMELTERLIAGGIIVVMYLITNQDPADYVKQGSIRRRIVVIPVEAGLEGRM